MLPLVSPMNQPPTSITYFKLITFSRESYPPCKSPKPSAKERPIHYRESMKSQTALFLAWADSPPIYHTYFLLKVATSQEEISLYFSNIVFMHLGNQERDKVWICIFDKMLLMRVSLPPNIYCLFHRANLFFFLSQRKWHLQTLFYCVLSK